MEPNAADPAAPPAAMPPAAPPGPPPGVDPTRSPAAGGDMVRAMQGLELQFAPASYDAARGEVDVIWSTGADVPRIDWWSGDRYLERLDLAGADLSRLNAGAPLLLDHYKAIENVVGSVVPGSCRVEGGRGVGRVRFDRSSAEGQAAEAKVAGGHVRSVSIGYAVQTWEKADATAKSAAVWTARAWCPFEISLVAVPADAGAGTRGAPGRENAPPPVVNHNPPTPAAAATIATRGAIMEPETTPAAAGTAPAPAAAVDPAAERRAGAAAERARIATISTRCRELSLGDDLARSLIDEGVSGDAIAVRLVDAMAAAQRKPPAAPAATAGVQVGASHDAPDAVRAAMVEAVAVSIAPAYRAEGERHAQFRGWRPSHFAGELLRLRGERVPFNPVELAERSFHATSDFPNLLAAAANKVLLQQYAQATPTYRKVMGRKSFRDFKAHSFLRAGDFPALLQIGESGEIKAGTISENKETAVLATYGRRIRVTRQLLINDDLGAFGDFSGMIGRRIVDFENATAFGVINTAAGVGPNLTDGAAVFTTGRANKSASNTAITTAAIGLGRKALREQKSLDGLVLNLAPKLLLCGTAKETEAETVLTPVAAAQGSNINLFAGRLQAEADANIAGNGWYLFADPEVAPVFVYGYLEGASGPQVNNSPVQGFDGFEISVVLDFGVGAIDYRGGYFNAGA